MLDHVQDMHITHLFCDLCQNYYIKSDKAHIEKCGNKMKLEAEALIRDSQDRERQTSQILMTRTNELHEAKEYVDTLETELEDMKQQKQARSICLQLAARDNRQNVKMSAIYQIHGKTGGMSNTFRGKLACNKGHLQISTHVPTLSHIDTNQTSIFVICLSRCRISEEFECVY